jgi:hypothetical protein
MAINANEFRDWAYRIASLCRGVNSEAQVKQLVQAHTAQWSSSSLLVPGPILPRWWPAGQEAWHSGCHPIVRMALATNHSKCSSNWPAPYKGHVDLANQKTERGLTSVILSTCQQGKLHFSFLLCARSLW